MSRKLIGDEPILHFWSRVTITKDCWLWDNPNKYGYGSYWFQGRPWRTHRLAFHLTLAPLTKGHSGGDNCVCHTCDNRACVRPSHLFLASQTDNIRDMIRKDRHRGAVGVRNRHAKLTEDDVRTIRQQYVYWGRNGGKKAITLAKEFGINRNMVRAIVLRESWAHVAD